MTFLKNFVNEVLLAIFQPLVSFIPTALAFLPIHLMEMQPIVLLSVQSDFSSTKVLSHHVTDPKLLRNSK